MKKRIISISLILAILFSFACTIPVSAAIEHEEQLYIDLGILPAKKSTGLIKPVLNREQLAEIIVNMQGMENLADRESLATDIERSSRKDAINYCISNNYLLVNENGEFRPTDSITYSEAIRAMITLLGYDVVIKNKTDDTEYFSIATKLGITKGVVVLNNQKMGYDEMYTLICRTMKINLPIHEFVSEDSAENLYDRLRVEERVGKLLANSRHSIGVERASVGMVNIDGILYRTELDIPNELIGVNVVYYLQDDEVVSFSPKTKLKYLKLTPQDIKSVKDTRNEIILNCNNEPETIRIKKSAIVIVNNKTMAPTKDLFEKFVDGCITLVETSGGNYGVIHMDIAKTVTVSATSQLSFSIRAKYNDELIKLEKAEKALEIYKNGKSAQFSDIKENSVVSIISDAFSFDERGGIVYDYNNISWAKIYISDISFDGEVDEIDDEGKIYVDDMDYQVAYSLKSLILTGKKDSINLGEYVNVKLDYWGNIADIEIDKENGGYNYGYLIYADVGTGLNRNLQLRLMDKNGVIGDYVTAKKFFVDGVPFKKASLTYDVGAAEDVDFTKRQVISYRLASDGTVKKIDTEIRSSKESEFSLKESLSFDPYALDQPLSKVRSAVVAKKVAIGNDCVMFVDSAGLGMTFPDDHYFSVRKPTEISGSESYYIALYDADEMGSTKCGVIYECYDKSGPVVTASEKKKSMKYSEMSYIVEGIRIGINDDGEEFFKLTLANYSGKENYTTVSGEYLEYYSIQGSTTYPTSIQNCWQLEALGEGGRSDTETIDIYRQSGDSLGKSLKPGDIVRFTLDGDANIKYIERIFIFNDVKDTTVPITGSSGTHMMFANLEKTSSGLFSYEVPGNVGTYEVFNTLSRPAVVIYDVETGEVTVEKNYSVVPSMSTGDSVKVWLRDYDGGTVMEYFVYLY